MAEDTALQVKIGMLHEDMIEMKAVLNRMSEALTKLALVEQQQSQIAQALERAFKGIAKMDSRVAVLEKSSLKTKETSVWVDRFVLAIVVAAGNYAAFKLGIIR